MPKIQNVNLKSRDLVTASGVINFDAEGIADVEENVFNSLVKLKGYNKLTINGEEPKEAPVTEEKEESKEEKVEFVKPKSHDEADELAEKLGMEPFEEGLKLKDKVTAIEEFYNKK